jgi:hypothetical protein
MLKQISQKLYLAAVLSLSFGPRVMALEPIFEGGGTETGVTELGTALGTESGITGTRDIGALIIKYVNFILPYLTLAAFLAFIYAGFMYVTAFGKDEQTEKAKKIMTYAVIGIVLVILSYGIVRLLTGELVEGLTPSA